MLLTGIYFPPKKTDIKVLHIFMCFQSLVALLRKHYTESRNRWWQQKKSPCWLKHLPTIWKGTAIACQCWVCVYVCCATDTRSLPGRNSLQNFPKFEGTVLRWKRFEWAQDWCRNVTAARICTKSLTPALLLPPGWPFLMALIDSCWFM